jgi:hypothetical protein
LSMCVVSQFGSAQQPPHLHEYEKANQRVSFLFFIIWLNSTNLYSIGFDMIQFNCDFNGNINLVASKGTKYCV